VDQQKTEHFASFVCAIPEIEKNTQLLRININLYIKKIIQDKPYTTSSILQRFRRSPEKYPVRLDTLLVGILKSHREPRAGLIEGLFSTLLITLKVSEKGLLEGFSNLPALYPHLSKALLSNKNSRQQFITWLTQYGQTLFSSREFEVWQTLLSIISNQQLEVYEICQRLDRCFNYLEKDELVNKEVVFLKSFLNLLYISNDIQETLPMPYIWLVYVVQTSNIKDIMQALAEINLVSSAQLNEIQKEIQEHLNFVNDEKYSFPLLENLEFTWKGTWRQEVVALDNKVKQELLLRRVQKTSTEQKETYVLNDVFSDFFSKINELGFSQGIFFKLNAFQSNV
jgi:hypothetical protein